LRAALYEDFLVDSKLAALKESGATYDLGFPVAEDLAEIVRAPALAARLDYEKAANGETLDERLLRDAAYSDALPLLQFTLQRLFEERRVEDGRASLTFAAYEANGGIDGAIDQAARRALAGLAETEVAALPRLLRRLATPIRDSGFAAKGRFALAIKPAPLAEVAGDLASKRLVDALVEARILLVSVEANTPVLRLAHQRVLESWAQARAIVENQAEFYRIRGEVADQAQRWAAGGRRADLLLAPGLALAEAESVAERFGDELDATEREFVTVSGRRARLRQRLTFAAAVVFAVVAIASVALGLVARREATKAEENYQVARQAANGLVIDIAEGLRNVEGMPATSIKRILATAKTVVDRLTSNAPDDPDLGESRAQMLRQFALNYSALGDLADASAYAAAAVAEARRVLAQRPGAASQQLLAASLYALGRVRQTQGLLDDARAAYGESNTIGAAMAATPADEAAGEEIEARALLGLSDLEVVGGDAAKGLEAAKRSLDVARALSAADPDNKTRRILLATALERSGNINGGIVTAYSGPTRLDPALPSNLPGIDYAAALSVYAESGAIFRGLAAKDPTDTDVRFRLETVLIRIGDLNLATGDLVAALAAHKEALAISSDLLSGDPGNADWKRRVEVNDEKLNRVYMAERDFAAALAVGQDALAIGARLGELDSNNLIWRRDLCDDWRLLGGAERALKQETAADDSFAKAIATCRDTASRFATNAIVKVELAFTLYYAGKGRPTDDAAPLWREAIAILDDLDHAGALPQAASNWAPFIRDRLAALNGVGPTK
jgi:tetratricopeptide (TPR) repeat protein